jgi:hypothetical protein
MNSIADNHLSNLAKKGRYGDTQMVQTSKTGPGKGNLWHVNKEEEALIAKYGQKGEQFVDKIGSGTINPQTGKEEKFLPILAAGAAALGAQGMIAGASLGLSMYQSWKQGRSEKALAKQQTKETTNQLAALANANIELDKSVIAKKNLVGIQSEREVEKLSEGTSKKIAQNTETVEDLKRQTGFAGSGQVEKVASESMSNIRSDFEFDQETLAMDYGQKLGEISGSYKAEKAKIKAEQERLESEKKLYEEQSRGWAQNKVMNLFS